MRGYTILLFLIALVVVAGCEENEPVPHSFTEQQIAAKNLAGDWGNATVIQSPDLESADAVRGLTMLFTVDAEGNPNKFYSDGSLSTFGNKEGTWDWASSSTTSEVVLTEIGPITSFTINYFDNIDLITIQFEAVNSGGRIGSVGGYEVSFQRQ